MLVEPTGYWLRRLPGAGDMVERGVASDAGLTRGEASYQERPDPQQILSRVIARITTRHGRETVADEFEARCLSCDQSSSQAGTELIVDCCAVPVQLIRSEALVSGARVE